jgi:hypothetical protein
MADALYATNRFTGDGMTTQFEFSFTGGYMDKAHVKAYIEDTATKTRTPITVTPAMFVGPYTLDLGIAAPVGSLMVIYRDTPKDVPLVDFVNGSRITEANLDKVAQQAVFIGAEVYDTTRVGEVLILLEAAGANANISAAAAAASALYSATSATDSAASAATSAASQAVSVGAAAAANISAFDANADAVATAALAASLSGGTIGFTASAYDFGAITDPTTYFDRDFGSLV